MPEQANLPKRNFLILGRTGAGKKTIVNQIFNSKVFELTSSPMESVTREATLVTRSVRDDDRKVLYNITILDTFTTEVPRKIFSQNILDYSSEDVPEDVPDGINLIIFVIKRREVYEDKELKMFRFFINNLNKGMRDLSALVITGCESLDDEQRKELVEKIKKEEATRDIARFMGKGIFPVGFPSLEGVKEGLRDVYQAGIAADSYALKNLDKDSVEMSIPLTDILKKMKELNQVIDSSYKGQTINECKIL